MPIKNLTPLAVGKLKPPASGQIDYFDKQLPGFGLRISRMGTKTYFVMVRVHGKKVRITLGRHPALDLKEARDKARDISAKAKAGKDPRPDLGVDRERLGTTFETLAQKFMDRHAAKLRPSTQREYKRILQGPDTKAWRNIPIGVITKHHVMDLIEQIEDRGSLQAANRSLAYLKKFFDWCARRDAITGALPTDRVDPPSGKVKRDRVLAPDEVKALWMALKAEQGLFSPLVKLLLLTGQRRSEVAGMRWEELDLEGDKPTWTIPADRTKNKEKHNVPLTPAVTALIEAQRGDGDSDENEKQGLVFSTTGITPLSGFSRAKARLDKRMAEAAKADNKLVNPEPWRFHDLRRTVVTGMNDAGIVPHVVEAVVNHISGAAKAGVAGHYNHAKYLDERRKALSTWASKVATMCSDNVVALSKAQRNVG